MGKIRFAMIGSLLREPIFQFTTISEQLIAGFQNGHQLKKMVPRWTITLLYDESTLC